MASEFLIVAEKVLQREQRPMRPKEIVLYAIKNRMFSDKLSGKTPHQTMKSKLSVHVRRMGKNSVFVRTSPGRFYLRSLIQDPSDVYEAAVPHPARSKEDVLVFPSRLLDKGNRFQGISVNWERRLHSILSNKECRYLDRIHAEQDNDHKQVVTYILVTRKGQLLAYKRGTFNRVEDFLRGSQCVGFGGHVSHLDVNLWTGQDRGISNCAARELLEELKLPEEDSRRLQLGQGLKIVGLLNDDSSAVGRRHFAVVFCYEVSDSPAWDNPERGEKSITQLRWIDANSAEVSLWDFEYWSQLCIRQYASELVRLQPTYRVRRRHAFALPHILCVLGEVGSGKSEATRVLREEFGYTEINSGQIMAQLLGIPPVPLTARSEFQKAAWDFISKPSGPKRLAHEILRATKTLPTDRILIDGIRQRATLEELKKASNGSRFAVLFVHTPPDVAYEFYKKRTGDVHDIHDYLHIRDNPVEEQVRDLISLSDAIVYNWTGRLQYRNIVRKMMRLVFYQSKSNRRNNARRI